MRAVLAEEASGLIGRLGFQGAAWIRAVPIYLFLIGIFGVFLPWQRGRSFLDAVILGGICVPRGRIRGPIRRLAIRRPSDHPESWGSDRDLCALR
jgi:hypothetical protein